MYHVTTWWLEFRLILCKYFGNNYLASTCKHLTPLVKRLTAGGENRILILDKRALTHCHECIQEKAIVCAWCQKPILFEDPVTLYQCGDPDFNLPSKAVVYQVNPLQVVGCLREGCAEDPHDRTGFWVTPGIVQIRPSPEYVAKFGTYKQVAHTASLSQGE